MVFSKGKPKRGMEYETKVCMYCTALYSENKLLNDETIWTVVMLLSHKKWIGKRAANLKGTLCGVIKIIETYRTKRPIDDCKVGDLSVAKEYASFALFLLDAVDRPRQQI